MKLHRGCDLVPDGTGLVCRQGRLAGVLMVLVFGAAFFFPAIMCWWRDAPSWVTNLLGLLATVIVLLMLSDVRARFRATNWILWIRPGSVCVNLRSYQDRSPLETLTAVELSDAEIDEVQRRTEHYTTPTSKGGTVQHKLVSLDLCLRESDSGELAKALAESRRVRQPTTTYLGFMSSSSGVTLYSVSLPQPSRIRIAWNGGQGHSVAPRLGRVLNALAARFQVAEPADDRRADWNKVADAALDDEILALVSSGNRIDAIKLLKLRRGMSTTGAHQFVEELAGK